MVGAYLVLLLLVGAERLVELRLSRRHAAAALARGGVELGQRHYFWMKILHTGFLLSAGVEVVALDRPFHPWLAAAMLMFTLAAQGLRYWCIATLGERWNTRVIVVPGLAAVQRGPYRYLRHPNYLAVIVEGISLPMIPTAWLTAFTFTILNAILLRVRIRCEEQALARYCDYDRTMAGIGRLMPVGG